MAAVVVTPTSGNITHLDTAVRVTCTSVSSNTTVGYDAANYPGKPAVAAFFKFSKTGQDSLKSPVLSTNADGVAEWNDVIIPAAGTWTLDLVNNSDGTTVLATASVVVA